MQPATPLQSTVVAATVFADRARLTRRARCHIGAGQQRVEFPDLPVAIDPNSVRVAVRGTIRATLLGVEVKKVFHDRPAAELVRKLQDQLQELLDQESAAADRVAQLNSRLAHINGVNESGHEFARGLARGKCKLAELAELQQFIEARQVESQAELRSLTAAKLERDRQMGRLRGELKQAEVGQSTWRFRAAVDVRLEETGEIEVDITYLINKAGWHPIYDVRYSAGNIKLSYLAEVQQKTGEDWTNVSLTLSTARPAVASKIPKLEPWNLRSASGNGSDLYAHSFYDADVAQKAATMQWTGASAQGARSAPKSAPPNVSRVASPQLEAVHETAEVESAGAAVTFLIPTAVDIPSDDSPHKVTVGVFDLVPTVDYVTVPKLADSVFRRAKAANASPYTILPGKAQLFINDDFFGVAELKLVAPKETFELFLGVDDRIRVERSQTKRDFTKSMLGGRKRIQYGFQIKLSNHTDKAQNLTVVDQAPRPQHEDIKVVVDSVEPKSDRQDDLNIIVWKLKLDAGAERKIVYEFTVDHPREMTVAGL